MKRHVPAFIIFLASFSFIFTACLLVPVASTSTDPQPMAAYVLVTANPQPTRTPFQPALASTLTEVSLSTPSPLPSLTPVPTDPPPTAIPPTVLPTDTQPPPPPITNADKPQYALSALMDYANHTVTVSEVVVYPNQSGDALASIVLAVNPNLWNGVFTLQNLSVNDAPGNYTLSGQWLTVILDPALQPGQTVKIGIGYQLTLPYSAAKFENFGYTYRQANLIDWYPYIVPYAGGGAWILHDPYPYGENLVYPLADFRVSLTFADATPPVAAASAPAALENGALVYNLPNARNFTITASPYYLLSTQDAGGITIYNYYFAEHANAAAMVQELTSEAVMTYSNVYGPYVHSALSVVETDLNDGLETDGLYFLAANFYAAYDGSVRNNMSVIAVHETAHQWWYGAVASDQAMEPWLDEALSAYSERIFYENNYPDALNWWWNFRIYYYNPSGYVDWHVYDTRTFRIYVNAIYFQGAKFIEDLRNRIGDQAFFAFIQDYYARNRGRIASADDFFAVLNLHTTTDYSDLVRAYFTYR
jgi:hypothetical protein